MKLNKQLKLTIITLAIISVTGCGSSTTSGGSGYPNPVLELAKQSTTADSDYLTLDSPIISTNQQQSATGRQTKSIYSDNKNTILPKSNPSAALCIYGDSKYKINSVVANDKNDFQITPATSQYITANCAPTLKGHALINSASRKVTFTPTPKTSKNDYQAHLTVNYSSSDNSSGSSEEDVNAKQTLGQFIDQSKIFSTTTPASAAVPITNKLIIKDNTTYTTYTYKGKTGTQSEDLQKKTQATHFGTNTFLVSSLKDQENIDAILPRYDNENFTVNIVRYLSYTTADGHVVINQLDNNGEDQWIDLPGSQKTSDDNTGRNINNLIIDNPNQITDLIDYSAPKGRDLKSGMLWWKDKAGAYHTGFTTPNLWPNSYSKNKTKASLAKAFSKNDSQAEELIIDTVKKSADIYIDGHALDLSFNPQLITSTDTYKLIPAYDQATTYSLLTSYTSSTKPAYIYPIDNMTKVKTTTQGIPVSKMKSEVLALTEHSYTTTPDRSVTPDLQYNQAETPPQHVLAYFASDADVKTTFNILKTTKEQSYKDNYTTNSFTLSGNHIDKLNTFKQIACSEFNGDSFANPTDCYLISYADKSVTIQEMTLNISSVINTATFTEPSITKTVPINVSYLKFDADTKSFIISDGSTIYKYDPTITKGVLSYGEPKPQKLPTVAIAKITGLYEF